MQQAPGDQEADDLLAKDGRQWRRQIDKSEKMNDTVKQPKLLVADVEHARHQRKGPPSRSCCSQKLNDIGITFTITVDARL